MNQAGAWEERAYQIRTPVEQRFRHKIELKPVAQAVHDVLAHLADDPRREIRDHHDTFALHRDLDLLRIKEPSGRRFLPSFNIPYKSGCHSKIGGGPTIF